MKEKYKSRFRESLLWFCFFIAMFGLCIWFKMEARAYLFAFFCGASATNLFQYWLEYKAICAVGSAFENRKDIDVG